MRNISDAIQNFGDRVSGVLGMANLTITFVDIIEIFIVSFLFYHILIWVKSTRAWNLFKGILVILIFVLLAALFQMNTILWIAENTLNVGLIAVVVIFQPELRSVLENIGDRNFLNNLFSFGKQEEVKISDHTIDELIKGTFAMGKVKTGALIVIEDEILLNSNVITKENANKVATYLAKGYFTSPSEVQDFVKPLDLTSVGIENNETYYNTGKELKEEIKENRLNIKNPELTLFMIIELTSSVVFNSITNGKPLPIDELKPYLYDSIRKLLIN